MSEPTPTFRDLIATLSPPWLRKRVAVRVLYSMAIQADAMGDALVAAVKLRLPGLYSAESLPMIGRDRRIRRGRLEVSDVYAGRLRRWLTDHRTRGGPYSLLAQLHAFFGASPFPIQLVYTSGARYTLATDGAVTRDLVSGATVKTLQWARWYLFYLTDSFPPPLSASDEDQLALIPREWIAAHCIGEIIVLQTGAELWNYPDGHVWNEPGTWNTAPVQRIKV